MERHCWFDYHTHIWHIYIISAALFTASSHCWCPPTAFSFLSAKNTSCFSLSKPQSVFWLFTSQPSTPLPLLFSVPRDFWWAAKKKKRSIDGLLPCTFHISGRLQSRAQLCFFFFSHPAHMQDKLIQRQKTKQNKEVTLSYFNVKFSGLLITRREDRTVDPPRILNLPGCNDQIQDP